MLTEMGPFYITDDPLTGNVRIYVGLQRKEEMMKILEKKQRWFFTTTRTGLDGNISDC